MIAEKNVFSGPDALKDFLNPATHPPLPLVELPVSCNPFHSKHVRIFAKLLNALPLSNVKSVPAYGMIASAQKKGKLENVHSLVEASSGNTVFSLAAIGRAFGISMTEAIVSQEVTEGKLQMLQLMGIKIRVVDESICPNPNDPNSSIFQAHKQGAESGWFNPGQFDNGDNPLAHEQWTGPQIWDQTDGKITIFAAGLGTAGTAAGVNRFLKNQNPAIRTVGAVRAPNNPVPGTRTLNQVNGVGFDWRSNLNSIVEVGTVDAFSHSLNLIREGLLVGPSSGFGLAGLLKELESLETKGELDKLRNEHGEVLAVFICCDSPLPYLHEYFTYLPSSLFPVMENENLLLYKKQKKKDVIVSAELSSSAEITPFTVIEHAYGEKPTEALENFKKGKLPSRTESFTIVDVSTPNVFAEHHLPNSINLDVDEILSNAEKYAQKWQNDSVIVVCPYGGRSQTVVYALRQLGVNAYNLKGGIMEWSRLNLPRVKDESCIAPRYHIDAESDS